MLYFSDYRIPQYPKGGGGNEYSVILEVNWRYGVLHEYNHKGYKRVWKLSSNDTFFSDIWFNGVNAV